MDVLSTVILLVGVYSYVKVTGGKKPGQSRMSRPSRKNGYQHARVITDRRWDANRFVERSLNERDREALNPADVFRYERDWWKRTDDELRDDIPTYVVYRERQQRLLTGNGAQLVNHKEKFAKANK